MGQLHDAYIQRNHCTASISQHYRAHLSEFAKLPKARKLLMESCFLFGHLHISQTSFVLLNVMSNVFFKLCQHKMEILKFVHKLQMSYSARNHCRPKSFSSSLSCNYKFGCMINNRFTNEEAMLSCLCPQCLNTQSYLSYILKFVIKVTDVLRMLTFATYYNNCVATVVI